MRTLMMAIGLAAVSAMSATAQGTTLATTSSKEPTAAVATSDSKDCLMRADANAWKTLGLTADQVKRVEDIKARHAKECAAKGEAERVESAPACKHEEEVKAVLSPAQYTKWQEWCKTSEKQEGSMEKQPEKKTDY